MNISSESSQARGAQWSIIDPQSALATLDQFDEIIDVRTAAEFAIDCLPGAINLPVLDDQQRIRIGLLNQQSPFEARRVGAALVAQKIAIHLQGALAQKPRTWRPLIYCWRGGGRSGAMTHVLERVGWPARQLRGGYKAWRAMVLLELDHCFAKFRWYVIGGSTGCGKTRLLAALSAQGAQVVDLEALACHRGSVLGALPSVGQPSQRAFESALWWRVRQFNPKLPVFIESESRKVGDLAVPVALVKAMRDGRFIQLNVPMASRIALLRDDYVHFENDPTKLEDRLDALVALHGRERVSSWRALAQANRWDDFVEVLLKEHYDASYCRSLRRNYGNGTNGTALESVLMSDINPDELSIVARTLIARALADTLLPS